MKSEAQPGVYMGLHQSLRTTFEKFSKLFSRGPRRYRVTALYVTHPIGNGLAREFHPGDIFEVAYFSDKGLHIIEKGLKFIIPFESVPYFLKEV